MKTRAIISELILFRPIGKFLSRILNLWNWFLESGHDQIQTMRHLSRVYARLCGRAFNPRKDCETSFTAYPSIVERTMIKHERMIFRGTMVDRFLRRVHSFVSKLPPINLCGTAVCPTWNNRVAIIYSWLDIDLYF